jgi:redox-sensitive bicupin YhaK (pirin superfamily)
MHAGQLNLMTAGQGIAHAEETPKRNSGRLSGVQLWVALPDEHRNMLPAFDHYASLPVLEFPGGAATLMMGALAQHRSPAKAFSPIIGADLILHGDRSLVLPLNPDFEHGVLVLKGDVALEDQRLSPERLYYLGTSRDEFSLTGNTNSRVLLIGGEPLREVIVMWWNFVARTDEEIAQAREDWANHRRFGEVKAYHGPRLDAPDILKSVQPEPAS